MDHFVLETLIGDGGVGSRGGARDGNGAKRNSKRRRYNNDNEYDPLRPLDGDDDDDNGYEVVKETPINFEDRIKHVKRNPDCPICEFNRIVIDGDDEGSKEASVVQINQTTINTYAQIKQRVIEKPDDQPWDAAFWLMAYDFNRTIYEHRLELHADDSNVWISPRWTEEMVRMHFQKEEYLPRYEYHLVSEELRARGMFMVTQMMLVEQDDGLGNKKNVLKNDVLRGAMQLLKESREWKAKEREEKK